MFDLFNSSALISNLSIFLFIIAGNYVGDIYSCSLRFIFNEYMIFKHIIGIFIMIFFVGLLQENITLIARIIQSIFLYIFYLIIMRAPTIISFTVIILLCVLFLINIYLEDLKKNNKKNENLEKNNNTINFLNNLINVLTIVIFTISIIGTLIFIFLLKYKLREKFSLITFCLGSRDQECFNEEAYNNFKKNPFFFEWNNLMHKSNKSKSNKSKSNKSNKSFIPKKIQKRLL